MENLSNAKKEFNQKLSKLKKDSEPALYETNLSDIVIYEKLLEIQKQIEKDKGKD
jgi:hypothetical protein